ncbi:hypothetical protein Q75_03060 [Bacillus coahuilensis p1.1.43]|uniref:DUF4350 domain-containing protein n=1 Tax=Bacillus coahuilensis p1.1.43 TaxID=1150625 RepID=A0A147KBA2_9BACI|nr:hypothetical protein Q75_03060 [Bacillus coahuilensis p1.1.43]
MKKWVGVSLLIAALVVGAYLSAAQKPKEYFPYDTDSPAPDGLKALYTYFNESEWKAQRWKFSPEELASEPLNHVLFIIEPLTVPSRSDMEDYKAFMSAGNTIILLQENPSGMFETEVENNSSIEEYSTVTNSQNEEFQSTNLSIIRLRAKDEHTILLEDDLGVLATHQQIGKGHLIISTFPRIITNEELTNRDHVSIFFELLEAGRVNENSVLLFDEYARSSEMNASIDELYPKWFLVLMMQGVLVGVLWIWMKGKRFGAIVTEREEYVRFSNERLRALSLWYVRGKQYQAALKTQANFVRQLVQERWGLSTSKEWQDLIPSLQTKLAYKDKEELVQFVNGLTGVLSKEKVSKEEFMLWSGKLDRLRKEVEHFEYRID